MSQKPPDENDSDEIKASPGDPWFYHFWPRRPWWGKFYEDSFNDGTAAEGCGLGCLLLLIATPLLVVVTDKNGDFKIQLVDLFCMTTLIGALCAYQANVADDLIWIDQIWVPLVIGLITGMILALVRQRTVWVFAGPAAVPVMWMLTAFGQAIADLYQ